MARYSHLWSLVDSNIDSALDFNEIVKLIVHLNLRITKKDLKATFHIFDQDNNGTIDKEEFVNLLDYIMERKEIRYVFFENYKDPIKNIITASGLRRFLKEVQKEDHWTYEECSSMIR